MARKGNQKPRNSTDRRFSEHQRLQLQSLWQSAMLVNCQLRAVECWVCGYRWARFTFEHDQTVPCPLCQARTAVVVETI